MDPLLSLEDVTLYEIQDTGRHSLEPQTPIGDAIQLDYDVSIVNRSWETPTSVLCQASFGIKYCLDCRSQVVDDKVITEFFVIISPSIFPV